MALLQQSPIYTKPTIATLLRRVKNAITEPIPSLGSLSCGICLDILHHPIHLPHCGHTFCSLCLEQAAQAGLTRCPYCRRVSYPLWSKRYQVDHEIEGKCVFYYSKEYKEKKKQDAEVKWRKFLKQWKEDWHVLLGLE